MPIMARQIYRDMLNFFRNQFASVLFLSLLTAIISVFLDHVFYPEDLSGGISLQQLGQQISVEQQMIFIKASVVGTFASLISNVLLVGGLLTMIRLVINNQPFSAMRAIVHSIPILPRLLLLALLTTMLVQLGLLFIIVPGILLAIFFSLSPIIATSDNLDAIKSMLLSTRLAFTNFWLLAPAVLLWLFMKASVLFLATPLSMRCYPLATLILKSLSNIISSLLLIYLYRLYMILKKI